MISLLLKRLSEAGVNAVVSGLEMQAHYGPLFDRLLRKRVLKELAPLTNWAVCAICECGVLTRPIQKDGERYRSDCPFDASADVLLGAEDLRRFRIEPERLAAEPSKASGLAGAELVFQRVWRIGTLPSGRTVAACFDQWAYVGGMAQPALALALRATAKGGIA